MSKTTSGHLSAFIPTIWSKEVTKAFEVRKVMAKLVSRFDADVKEKGDTIKVPNVSNLTATYKVQTTDVPLAAATETSVSVSIDKWAVHGIAVEDIARIQSAYPNMQYYAEKLGESVAKLQDTDVMSLYTSFSNTIGATSNNVGLAWSYILGAIRVLDAANVPGTDRSLTVEAYGLQALRSMDQFVRYDATGRAGKQESGSLDGTIFGVGVKMTNQAPVTTSLVTGMLFHKEAMILAEQRGVRVQYDYDVRSLTKAVVADLLYGVKARRTGAAVRVQYGQT